MYDFGNRIAVVTGAGKGIGKSIAQRFMKEGVQGLALLDFDFERVSQTQGSWIPKEKSPFPFSATSQTLRA